MLLLEEPAEHYVLSGKLQRIQTIHMEYLSFALVTAWIH